MGRILRQSGLARKPWRKYRKKGDLKARCKALTHRRADVSTGPDESPGAARAPACARRAEAMFRMPMLLTDLRRSAGGGDVESGRALTEREFYDLESFASRGGFLRKVCVCRHCFGFARWNGCKGGETPREIISEERPGISPDVLNRSS